jgi:hypothetical protein
LTRTAHYLGWGSLLLALLLALTDCHSPGKRTGPSAKGPEAARQQDASAAPPQDGWPWIKDRLDEFLDPARPCLTRAKAARGQLTLNGKRNRSGLEAWMAALNTVFHELEVACADDQFLLLAITTIQIESNVRTDPYASISNLEELYAKRLRRFRQDHQISAQLLNLSGLDRGVRAKLRQDTLRRMVRTEGDLERYVTRDLRPWLLDTLRSNYLVPSALASAIVERNLPDPIHTIGPMQVDFSKAYRNARRRGEKIESPAAMKRLLLEGETALYWGLKEGVYMLWSTYRHYRTGLAAEDAVLYTAVDYNTGEFSARNAAFQEQAATLAGRKLKVDGDLLLYTNGLPDGARSLTEETVARLLATDLPPSAIRRDLLYEKEAGFSGTDTARKVCARFEAQVHQPCPQARMPVDAANPSAEIRTGTLTTPAAYGKDYLRRFRTNLAVYHDPALLEAPPVINAEPAAPSG